ncbi:MULTISPECIES: tripartite tricarboxylate transporter substrate binding protein [unclassified Variovorax]|uniref:tripartite tricarboxylate transporter substrate binding protein n=1 Tax=unclassified Variovorax TaxID=663243 RepID=UPI0008AC91CC|nr:MULTISPECIES: tripartite tricarboxylate transporter substrate binding protein [unclassified Variovorax]SEK16153.1 Tripartite-type tricarboxylate transporter, receptor component TctC [Variovorax sp. OK202]SFE35413.1 Tripartite-type tricarboxylate transporter, receptor component TctC [Variovorax sp. OK212]
MTTRIAHLALAGLCTFGTLGAAFASLSAAAADAWPAKPVTIIAPFAAGGSTDLTARMIAAKLREQLGQSFVVDNRAGAAGNIGADMVAKAAPDGYTLLLATSSHVTNMALYKSLSYDFVRDLVPVAPVAFIPSVLVVHPSVPAKDLAGFIQLIRDPAGKVNYGSSGGGSSPHLAAEVFNKMAKGQMVHVPYKGSGPALVDLLGGQIQAVFSPFVDALPYIKAGKLRALGMTSKRRSPLLPELPAIGEALPGYDVVLWNGIFAPAKTPPKVVAKLNAAIGAILRQEETKRLLAEQGSEPLIETPDEFRKFVAAEVPKWRSLVDLAGARVD